MRTSLMTWIFLSPAASRMTSNSSCSSATSAAGGAAAGRRAAATATGAAAVTPKVSSNCFTNSESSMRVISLNASRRSSVLSFAMVAVLPYGLAGWGSGSICGGVGRRSVVLGSVSLVVVGCRSVASAAAVASAAPSAAQPRVASADLGGRPPRRRPAYRPRRAGSTGRSAALAAAPRPGGRSGTAALRTATRRRTATPSSRRRAWPAAPRATRGRRACLISSARQRLAVQHAALDHQQRVASWRSRAGPWPPRPGRP